MYAIFRLWTSAAIGNKSYIYILEHDQLASLWKWFWLSNGTPEEVQCLFETFFLHVGCVPARIGLADAVTFALVRVPNLQLLNSQTDMDEEEKEGKAKDPLQVQTFASSSFDD